MSARIIILLVAAAVALPVSFAGCVWFTPAGIGEYRHSPDERYTAHAFNMSTGTLLGGRDKYIEIRVVEESTGRVVWRIVHRHQAGANVPDYGSRVKPFIIWASDS